MKESRLRKSPTVTVRPRCSARWKHALYLSGGAGTQPRPGMQCWYWAKLGVDNAIVETAKAVAMKARRIGVLPFRRFRPDCRSVEPRAGPQQVPFYPKMPRPGHQFRINESTSPGSSPAQDLHQPKIFTSPRS